MRSVINVLSRKLIEERKTLELCNEQAQSSNPLNVRWANGNISSCGVRIAELEIALELVRQEEKRQEEKRQEEASKRR